MVNGTIRYGRVVAYVTTFITNPEDPELPPIQVPLEGEIVIAPRNNRFLRWTSEDEPTITVLRPLICPVYNGHLYPPGTTRDDLPPEHGVIMEASSQPDAEPNFVQFYAHFKLQMMDGCAVNSPPSITFNVPIDDTVDLATVEPDDIQPGVIIVYSSLDREYIEEALAKLRIGQPNGIAELDSEGHLPYQQLPGDILSVPTLSEVFEATIS